MINLVLIYSSQILTDAGLIIDSLWYSSHLIIK